MQDEINSNQGQSDRALLRSGSRQVAIPTGLLLPILLAILAGLAVAVVKGSFLLPVPSFYTTSAQIIPILLVAFAVESRAVSFMAQPQAKIYRAVLFLFLLIGELSALLGASGALRENGSITDPAFATGYVAASGPLSNVLAGVTAAGLVGGFVMVAILALSGPGWLVVSRPGPASNPGPTAAPGPPHPSDSAL